MPLTALKGADTLGSPAVAVFLCWKEAAAAMGTAREERSVEAPARRKAAENSLAGCCCALGGLNVNSQCSVG